MRKLITLAIFSTVGMFGISAHAGNYTLAGGPTYHQTDQHQFPKKYTVENGVKVYRIQADADQRAATNLRRVRLADQEAYERRLFIERDKVRKKVQKVKKKAFKRGYDQGYHEGYEVAGRSQRAACSTCYRRRIRLRQRIRTRPIVSGDVLRRRNLQ